MAFKIWCETNDELEYVLNELIENNANIADDFTAKAPCGITVVFNIPHVVDRECFEALAYKTYSAYDDMCDYLIFEWMKDGGGIWINDDDDLDTFLFFLEDYPDLDLLDRRGTVPPCGLYLVNPTQIGAAKNMTHAERWIDIDGNPPETRQATGQFMELWNALRKSANESRRHSEEDAVNHPHAEGDAVNHPKHYASSCSLECIDVMRTVFGDEYTAAGCLFNTFKYLWRYKYKGHPEEDLAKANWYFDRAEDLIPNVEYNDELAEISIRLKNLMEDIDNG